MTRDELKINLPDNEGFLVPYPETGSRPAYSPLSVCVGVHGAHCRGFVDREQISENWSVLLCRSCKMRIKLHSPSGSIWTWETLAKALGNPT